VLEALIEAGLVERRREVADSIAVYYSLTEKGRALEPLLDDVGEWADEWVADVPADPNPRPRAE
jgi:DNA-binding HxlR family transcriptional regulator